MKKILVALCVLVATAGTSFAFDMNKVSLLTSMTDGGALAGGFRYALGDDLIAEASLSSLYNPYTDENEIDYWFDIYKGNFGVLLGDVNDMTIISGLYAVEQPLTQKVSLGISTSLITLVEDMDPQFLDNWMAYLVIAAQ